jgi:ectoine hydroxylase-related dioxygenase (phytanoyl-CoA dioxygenase family)
MNISTEEIKINGYAYIGKILSDEDIGWFNRHITFEKQKEIDTLGVQRLRETYSLETIQDLGRYEGKYYELIKNNKINEIVNKVLNEKAVIFSYNAIVLNNREKSDVQGYKFHRDMPWFPGCCTSILVMIPLVDYDANNGSTQLVPGTHLLREMPSLEYLEKHKISVQGKAGEAYVVDATVWHRSGKNLSTSMRPMIVLRYVLAPFKQQIEFYISNKNLADSDPLVKQRLGWNVRVPHNHIEGGDWNPETRKFKSGQYDMTNIYRE